MNTKNLILSALVSLVLGTATLHAQTVDFKSLPPSVQQVINQRRGDREVLSITRLNGYDVPVYLVSLTPAGPNSDFFVTQGGTVIQPKPVPATSLVNGVRDLDFADLPPDVQGTVRRQTANAPIHRVVQITMNGRVTYDIPYAVETKTMDLWIDSTGQVLMVSPPRATLTDPSRVTFDGLPKAVQTSARVYAAGRPMENITSGRADKDVVYEVTVENNGQTVPLRFTPNGALVEDSVDDRFLVSTGRFPLAAHFQSPLTEPVALTLNQLPDPVQRTAERYAGTEPIRAIEKGTVNGHTVYQLSIFSNDQEVPLRILPDGNLVQDSASQRMLNAGQAPGAESGQGAISQH